jgi:hypothetical protein
MILGGGDEKRKNSFALFWILWHIAMGKPRAETVLADYLFKVLRTYTKIEICKY